MTRSANCEIGIFNNVSREKAIGEPVLLGVIFFWISVTKLWDKIIRQGVCKGRTGHANVVDSKSSWLTNNDLYIVLPFADKWLSKT